MRASPRIPSESITFRSSNATSGGRAGRVPTAMMIDSALSIRSSSCAVRTATV